mgnify:FL=1
MSGIETTQLTTAVINVGQLTTKMYKEMRAQSEQQAKDIRELAERVDTIASQTANVDLKPIVENLDAFRTEQLDKVETFRAEQLEAVEIIANIVKPVIGGQSAIQTDVTKIGNDVNKQEEAFKKLIQAMAATQKAIETINANQQQLNERMTRVEEATMETASRVKTLGVQVSGLMTTRAATDEDFVAMMEETTNLLKNDVLKGE